MTPFMTTLVDRTDTLTRDALAVLQPGFVGTTAPDWLLRRIGEGLSSVGLFGRNIASPGQLAALTAQLRAERATYSSPSTRRAATSPGWRSAPGPPSPATTPWEWWTTSS